MNNEYNFFVLLLLKFTLIENEKIKYAEYENMDKNSFETFVKKFCKHGRIVKFFDYEKRHLSRKIHIVN